jgi:hypothetical protein
MKYELHTKMPSSTLGEDFDTQQLGSAEKQLAIAADLIRQIEGLEDKSHKKALQELYGGKHLPAQQCVNEIKSATNALNSTGLTTEEEYALRDSIKSYSDQLPSLTRSLAESNHDLSAALSKLQDSDSQQESQAEDADRSER